MLTLSTDIALSDEVTVTATNSGGQAAASFRVTVEAPEFPGFLEDSSGRSREVRDAAPEGRRQVTIAAGVVPAGYELCLYSGPAEGRSNADWRKVMQAGATYVTTSSLKVGTACLNLLFWRRVADGAWAVASNEVVFPIDGLAATGGTADGGGGTGGEASQTLGVGDPGGAQGGARRPHRRGRCREWIDRPAERQLRQPRT